MKYHIITYGCQMNKNDSERIAAVLEKMGMKKAKDKNSADFIVLNTCSVRQTAEDRVFGEIQNLKSKISPYGRSPVGRQKPFIAITGCMIGRDKDGEIRKKLPGVDIFFEIDELPLLVSRIAQNHTEQNTEPHRNHPQLSSPSSEDREKNHPHLSSPSSEEGEGREGVPGSLPLAEGEGREGEKLQCGSVSSVARSFVEPGVHYLSIYPYSEFKASRYLTIQTGCNEFCSYCVVPYARGGGQNRPLKEILKEAKKLIKEGASEIVLLGQIVNKWQASDAGNFSSKNPFKNHFAALLWELNQFNGLEHLSFISPHPKCMTDEIIQALILPKMSNYLHLPVQSGDDEILRKMNRKYTAGDYFEIIKKIRKVRPKIELGTDIIVGFPGETEKQFRNTVKLCKKMKFNVAYIAMYSPRSGTAAYKNFPDDIPHKVKKERWNILNTQINTNKNTD